MYRRMSSGTEGKFEDLPLKHKNLSDTKAKVKTVTQEPIKKLLRKISESKNMNAKESLTTRYTKIVGVVAAYW